MYVYYIYDGLSMFTFGAGPLEVELVLQPGSRALPRMACKRPLSDAGRVGDMTCYMYMYMYINIHVCACVYAYTCTCTYMQWVCM